MSVEVGFYLVLPFVASIFFRKPVAGLLVSPGGNAAWTIAFDHVSEVTDLIATAPDPGELVSSNSSELQLPAWAYLFGLGMFRGPGSGSGSATGRGRGEAETPVPGRVPRRPHALVSGLPRFPWSG